MSPDDPRPRSLRPFFTLWTGQLVSLIGSQAVQFALIWWLTRETGSPTILALATLLGLAPQVVLGPFAGALVDRWSRRAVMIGADLLAALAAVALAALFAATVASPTHVLVILFVRSVCAAFHGPALTATTTLMVPADQLTRIQGLNQTVQGGQLILSAPLGGLMLALMSMPLVMVVEVVTALCGVLPLLWIRVPEPIRADSATGASLIADLRAGFGYLTERRGLLILLLGAGAINLFLVPAFALLPLLVREELSGTPLELGWIMSLFGIGTIVGGLALGVWGGFRSRVVTSLVGVIVLGAASLALGLTGSMWGAFWAMALVGAAATWVNGPIQAVLQATVAPEFQGRVFGLMASVAGAMAPIGLIVAAPVGELVGVRAWYVAGSITAVLCGLAGFGSPALLRLEDATAAEAIPQASPGVENLPL